MTEADDHDKQLDDLETVTRTVTRRLDIVQPVYGQIVTSLWAGNGAAALACLSFIGVAWKNGSFPHLILIPLWLFVLGLISMGVGTFAWLMRQRNVIRPMETANSLLDITVDSIERPSESIGLSRHDWRTRGAIAAAAFFVSGSYRV